jgi:mRNA-degrading endonuclease HigB of HigAB toxin-antitoxin module
MQVIALRTLRQFWEKHPQAEYDKINAETV